MANVNNFFSILPATAFRHKLLLSGIFSVVVLLSIIYVIVAKKQYSSSMSIEVQNTRETQAVSSATLAQQGSGMSPDLLESHINSEVELLISPDLLQELVTYRGTLLPSEEVPAPGSEAMSRAMLKLSKRLEVNPVRKSAIIEVSYRDYSPGMAQKVLQYMQQEYLKKHVSLERPAGTSRFFREETDTATKERQVAEQALAQFQSSNGFVSLSREKELLAENLDKAKVSVLQDMVDQQSTSRQVSDLNQQMASTPRRISTVQQSGPSQYTIQQLTAQLTDLKNKRISLSARYVPDDLLVREVNQQITETERTLDGVRIAGSETKSTDNNPSWLAMDLLLKNQHVALEGEKARLAEHREQEQHYTTRLKQLQEITPANDALEQRAQDATMNQRTLIEKRDTAEVDDLLDFNHFGNVAIALAPTFSSKVVKPAKLLDLALGLLTALVLCVATGVVLESGRETMLTPAEVEANTGFPVLATVPEVDGIRSILGFE